MPPENPVRDAADAAAAFHALHHGDEPLLLPNAWDHASAAALVAAGFPAIGTTSLGVAAALGLPDGKGRTQAETVALVHRLRLLPCLLTVDLEAGFGADPAAVARMATEVAEAGAVGINLEDGRPDGTLADPGHQAEVLRAVKARVPRLFLNARVDTYWLGRAGAPLADAAARAERYAEAGADGIFVPGVADPDEIRALVAATPLPLNVLYLPGRHTRRRLADLGVRRVSTGSLLFRAAVDATVTAALAVRDGAPSFGGVPGYAAVQRLATWR